MSRAIKYSMLKDLETSQPSARPFCWTCRQTARGCYCTQLRPFDSRIEFVILIHKIESRRRIASGRMAYLALRHSHLIEGEQFQNHALVNQLIEDPVYFNVVLYPGRGSVDISNTSTQEQAAMIPNGRKLRIFVIDGTWATARRTMRESHNLAELPRICFLPTRESQFKVRKQPAPHCLSTLEAIHHTIERLGKSQGFETETRTHDHLLDLFSFMVEGQRSFLIGRNRRTVSREVLQV